MAQRAKKGGQSSALAAIDDYWEYSRIVGEDDGGKTFTPEQYEAYKAKMLPQRAANRLFTSWTNPSGMDCLLVGPQSLCFCGHRYIGHKTDYETLPAKRPVPTPCRQKGCKCQAFEYLPRSGGGPIRCTCKHPGDEHSADPKHLCQKSGSLLHTSLTVCHRSTLPGALQVANVLDSAAATPVPAVKAGCHIQ